MTSQEMLRIVRTQLAIDLNCLSEDFGQEGFVFCEARENPGRRPFPRGERHFEMLTMGDAVIVSATSDILPFLREQLDGKSREEAFVMPFVYGTGHYCLLDNPCALPLPEGISFNFIEGENIHSFYSLEGFRNAIQYDANHPRPDVLAIAAKKDEVVVGMAGASDDCEMMWQIGYDVLPEYRSCGIASVLTNRLVIEILERGKIPYCGIAPANIASQRVAYRAGFRPAWTCVYRGRFDDALTSATG